MKKDKIYALKKGSVSNQMFSADMLGAVLNVAQIYGASVKETKVALKEIRKELDDFVIVQGAQLSYMRRKNPVTVQAQNPVK